MVTSDNITLFIHTQATISIAVIGKTDIQPLLYHELLQTLNVGRTSIVVDVQTVGLCIDDVGIGSQSIKHRLGNVPAGAVGTVQTDLDTLKGVDTEADQIAHVAVATGHIVHRAANVFPVSERQLRPVLIEHMELAVDVVLHQQQSFLGHFLAVAVNQLDTVIVVRVVAGRNHDATVEVVHAGDISHGGRGGDMEQVGIRTGSGQTCDQAILEHIRAAAGVLSDDDAGRLVVAIALTQSVIIPAQKTTNLVGVVGGQSDSSFATEAIGSKILSHYSFSSSKE